MLLYYILISLLYQADSCIYLPEARVDGPKIKQCPKHCPEYIIEYKSLGPGLLQIDKINFQS